MSNTAFGTKPRQVEWFLNRAPGRSETPQKCTHHYRGQDGSVRPTIMVFKPCLQKD